MNIPGLKKRKFRGEGRGYLAAVIAGHGYGRSLHLQDLLLVRLLYVEVEDEFGGVATRGSAGGEHVILHRHGQVYAHLLQQLPA